MTASPSWHFDAVRLHCRFLGTGKSLSFVSRQRQMTSNSGKRNSIALVALGFVFTLAYGLLPISFGETSLPSAEAWSRGVAQPYVMSGVVLIVLALWLRQGQVWVRWAILFWCPVTIVGASAWASLRGVGSFDSIFLIAAGGIVAIWFWGVSRMLFAGTNESRS